jgi:hypothetical protein
VKKEEIKIQPPKAPEVLPKVVVPVIKEVKPVIEEVKAPLVKEEPV